MITLEAALSTIKNTLAHTSLPRQVVPIRQAVGRFLLSDVRSRLDLPPFDKSAMDGYAILEGDERSEYRVLETVRAGKIGSAELSPGAAVKIMTGAKVPANTGRVVMLEDTTERNGMVTVHKHTKAANICKMGEDIKAGQLILKDGRRLDETDISNAIACGVGEVAVARQAKAAIISTGDEIVESFEELTPGKIMNSNGPMLSLLCRKHGLDVVAESSVTDDPAALEKALAAALECADLVALSGGVSVGEYDYVPDVMRKLGLEIHFDGVAIKPGKPTTFASRGKSVVFGLPGNPVAVYLTFHLFVLWATALMSGATQSGVRRFQVPLARDFARRKADRQEYLPSRLNEAWQAEILEFHGSAHLAALMEADGFAVVPQGASSRVAGDKVEFMPLKGMAGR